MLPLGSLALGFALLLAGRRLFWLFVGVLGFVATDEFIAPMLSKNDPVVALIVAVIAGLGGALLAIFLQKVAIGLAGAIAGAYYLHVLLGGIGAQDPRVEWIALLIGAVVGALLLLFLFRWALILFSSIVGAHLIVSTMHALSLSPDMRVVLFLGLLVGGLIFQGRSGVRKTDED